MYCPNSTHFEPETATVWLRPFGGFVWLCFMLLFVYSALLTKEVGKGRLELILFPVITILRQVQPRLVRKPLILVAFAAIFLSALYESIVTTDVLAPRKIAGFSSIRSFLDSGFKVRPLEITLSVVNWVVIVKYQRQPKNIFV